LAWWGHMVLESGWHVCCNLALAEMAEVLLGDVLSWYRCKGWGELVCCVLKMRLLQRGL